MIHFSTVRVLGLSALLSCVLANCLLAMDDKESSINRSTGFGGCVMPKPKTLYYFAPVDVDNFAWPYEVERTSPDFTKVFVEQYNEISGTFFLEKINDATVLLHSLKPGRFGLGGIFLNLYEVLKNRHPNLTTIYANVLESDFDTRESLVNFRGFEETDVYPSSYAKHEVVGYIGHKKTL